jgi:glutathione S-transferase
MSPFVAKQRWICADALPRFAAVGAAPFSCPAEINERAGVLTVGRAARVMARIQRRKRMIEIYWGSGSPYAWRALLALEIKKIPYTARLIEFSKGQHKAPEFLALNPRGRVPTIKDGDFVLWESLAILAYLDRKMPEPPLFGRTAEETGRIWRAISEATDYLEAVGDRIVSPIFFNKATERAEDIRKAIEPLHAELKRMENALSGSRWIAGDSLSAADIVAYPMLETLLRAASKESAKAFDLGLLPIDKTYPAIAAWRDRIMALPGYERTYPPHWRTAPQPAPVAAAS